MGGYAKAEPVERLLYAAVDAVGNGLDVWVFDVAAPVELLRKGYVRGADVPPLPVVRELCGYRHGAVELLVVAQS